jgi:hypothetical protein
MWGRVIMTGDLEAAKGKKLSETMPWGYFALEAAYLLVLVWLFWHYVTDHGFRSAVHDPFGPLPLVVPWAGAVGAVTVGMFGIYFHNETWDKSYTYWYVARPLTGLVLGSFAYVFLIAIINATGTQPKTSSTFLYAAAAFIVGFRERTFFNLLTQATDVVFGPAKQQDGTKGS